MSSSPTSVSDPTGSLGPAECSLLQRRAERMARVSVEDDEARMEVVVFIRDGARYALAIDHLREIRPLRALCEIPQASAAVPGVFYYRGEIVSVHDLAALLHGAGEGRRPGWVLVAETERERLGLLADEVDTVALVAHTRLRPVPLNLGDATPCFQGIVEPDILLIHPPALFSNPRFYRAIHT